jgi:hypothetical protein
VRRGIRTVDKERVSLQREEGEGSKGRDAGGDGTRGGEEGCGVAREEDGKRRVIEKDDGGEEERRGRET